VCGELLILVRENSGLIAVVSIRVWLIRQRHARSLRSPCAFLDDTGEAVPARGTLCHSGRVTGGLSLALFAWLLSLHPTAAGRVYAAYGGVYIGVAILWLWLIDSVRPITWDLVGSAVALIGMAIIMFGPRHA
jgi:drug/metabolite transporter superfamily protein YnfA